MKNKLLLCLGIILIISSGCNSAGRIIPEKPLLSQSILPSLFPEQTPIRSIDISYEKYCQRVLCEPIEANIVPKLKSPADIAVTNNGKTLYVLNARKFITNCNGEYEFIDRQFIYKISEVGKISVIKTQDGFPNSCTLSEQIETDKNDNIYVSSPVIDTNLNPNNRLPLVIGQKLIKITNEAQSSFIGDFILPSNTDKYGMRLSNDLGYLDVSKDDNSIYFSLDQPERYTSFEKTINRLKTITDFDKIFSVGSGSVITPFEVKDNKIYFGTYYIDIPYFSHGTTEYKEVIHLDKSTFGPTKIKFNSKGEIIGTFSIENKICKIVPNDKIYCIAGNGNVGFKDGKGLEAQFNNPLGLDIDAQDNIYVADTGNNAIRKITPDGVVTTLYSQN
jgi:DNA-binding beta-propeller fold protein YncE